MSLSEKFEDIKFSKSVAGYAQKEVDGFISDILPALREQEQLISALRVKLEAFEGKSEEIRKTEQQAYKLLEAAKQEAQIIVAAAKKNAEDITNEARVASEVQVRAATARAAEVISAAEKKANAHMAESSSAAEKIIAAADAKGKELLEKVMAVYNEEERKAKALSNECAAFEKRFCTIVSNTAKALAKLKEEAPFEAEVKAEEKVTEVIEEAPLEEPKIEETVTEVEIVGGMPKIPSAKIEEVRHRRLYDSVNVTYEKDEDDFSEIRDIMKGNGLKSPTHFSE